VWAAAPEPERYDCEGLAFRVISLLRPERRRPDDGHLRAAVELLDVALVAERVLRGGVARLPDLGDIDDLPPPTQHGDEVVEHVAHGTFDGVQEGCLRCRLVSRIMLVDVLYELPNLCRDVVLARRAEQLAPFLGGLAVDRGECY